VFNAIPQSASEYLHLMLEAGVRKFRIEFIDEPADEVTRVVSAYRPAIDRKIDGRKLWRELRASSKLGVTRGSLDH
jgi:putative protease